MPERSSGWLITCSCGLGRTALSAWAATAIARRVMLGHPAPVWRRQQAARYCRYCLGRLNRWRYVEAMARILVVDDAPELGELIQTVLTDEGHAVEAVLGGQGALERLGQTVYDLVVCDLAMPDIDGAAVAPAVEHLAPPRPALLLMTGYADRPTYGDFLQDDAGGRVEQAGRHRGAARVGPTATRESVSQGRRGG